MVIVAVVLYLAGLRTDYDEAWSLSGDDAQSGALLDVYVAGDVLVRATDAGVTGYRLADGEQQWQYRPPTGRHLCTISPTAPDGIAVAAYGGEACTEAVAIDTSSGKAEWRAPLVTGTNEQEPRDAAAAVADGVAVVSNGRVTGLDLKTGKQRWTIGPPDINQCRSGDTMADGDVVLAMVDCSPRDESAQDDTLVSVDPSDGSSRWLAAVKNESGQRPPRLLNVSPPVLHLARDGHAPEYGTVDDEGKNPVVFAAKVDTAAPTQRAKSSHLRSRVTVVGQTLIEVGRSGKQPDVAYGHDLTTGKTSWHKVKLAGAGGRSDLVTGSAVGKEVTAYTVDADGVEHVNAVDVRTGGTRTGAVVRSPLFGSDAERIDRTSWFAAGGSLVEVGTSDDDFTVRAYSAD